MYGEEGLNDFKKQGNYHSYTYYQDNFGIYDDDPQIVTLNRNDFCKLTYSVSTLINNF